MTVSLVRDAPGGRPVQHVLTVRGGSPVAAAAAAAALELK